jgi:predicted glycosyltransferase
MRARQFAAFGLLECLEPEGAAPAALASAIRRRLEEAPAVPWFPIDGIDNVVRKMDALIESHDSEPLVLRA